MVVVGMVTVESQGVGGHSVYLPLSLARNQELLKTLSVFFEQLPHPVCVYVCVYVCLSVHVSVHEYGGRRTYVASVFLSHHV